MKLAFLIFKYYPYGGLQRDCLRLAKYCAERGHQVEIITMQWQGPRPDTLKVRLLPRRGFSNHARASNFAKDVAALLPEFDKVIGFDRMPNLDFYFTGDLCFAATAKEKHGFWFRYSPRYRSFLNLEKQLFEKGSKTKIFVLTEQIKRTYQEYYHTEEQRFILIPPGLKRQEHDLDFVQSNKEKNRNKVKFEGEFNLLQVGSDFKRKGVHRAIHAIAALSPVLKNKTHLYIIGSGDAIKYEKLAKKLNIFDQIHFVGTTDNVADYMRSADLLLHTAYFETTGTVLAEALTFGLPLIVTENCGYAFHIAKANAGSIIPAPFLQENLNRTLETMLVRINLDNFSKNALNYAQFTDLYSMDQQCLQAIEQR